MGHPNPSAILADGGAADAGTNRQTMGGIPHNHHHRLVHPSGAVRIVETLWDCKARSAGRQCNGRLLSPLGSEKESEEDISLTAPPLTSRPPVDLLLAPLYRPTAQRGA